MNTSAHTNAIPAKGCATESWRFRRYAAYGINSSLGASGTDGCSPVMPTAKARSGEPLKIRERDVPFSFWPTGEGGRRDFLQSRVFASNPWETIRINAMRRASPNHKLQVEGLILQGQDLFRAAQAADIRASRPLLLYYAFMQAVKAYAIVCNRLQAGGKVFHGLTEGAFGGAEFLNSRVTYLALGPQNNNIFPAFYEALTGSALPAGNIGVSALFNQILIGHRLFTQLTGEPERFVEVSSIRFLKDSRAETIAGTDPRRGKRPNAARLLKFPVINGAGDALALGAST